MDNERWPPDGLTVPCGVALRFARVKGYRQDKSPEDADTIDAVRSIHDERAS